MGRDLASTLVQQPTPGMRYAQGRIIAWDPDTFANRIQVGNTNTVHENLPVVGTTDALSYQPGQLVALYGMDPTGSGGGQQWWIAGRLFTPGGDNAEALVDFMRGSLARQISAEIFADRIHPVVDTSTASRTSTSWGDPTSGTAGPAVTGVSIETGTALIMLSAWMRFSTEDTTAINTSEYAGAVGLEISGATSVAPADLNATYVEMFKYNNGGITTTDGVFGVLSAAYTYPQTGLNPGLHDFTMKYRTTATATAGLQVLNRSLTVIAF